MQPLLSFWFHAELKHNFYYISAINLGEWLTPHDAFFVSLFIGACRLTGLSCPQHPRRYLLLLPLTAQMLSSF